MTSTARELEAAASPTTGDSEGLEELFAELDGIIAEHAAEKATAATLKAKQKKLAALQRAGNRADEAHATLVEIRRLEEAIVWRTVSTTALFHTQHCTGCGTTTRFFVGWMAEQHHRHDATGRRLLAGRPVEQLPERIEEHDYGCVPFCASCIERQFPQGFPPVTVERPTPCQNPLTQPVYHRSTDGSCATPGHISPAVASLPAPSEAPSITTPPAVVC